MKELVRNSQGRDPRTQKDKSGLTAGKKQPGTGPKDQQLVKEHSQRQARTGENWLRQEDCEPTDGESGTHVQ